MKRFKMKKLILFVVVIPLLAYSDGEYTGDRILKAAQKYGMTDSELNYLIDNTGPNLTLKDPQFGATALIHACVNNRPNMVKILIERGGSDIDEVDKNGETCLIGASRKGNIEVVNILLQSNARRDIVGNLNKSAFDYAVELGHTEIARLLGGPPKQKVSFKTIAKIAVDKKPGGMGASSLSSQKYIQDLGKISLIVESMKPLSPGAPGKVEVNKLNEIAKITGLSDVVKRQMSVRDQMEEKLRLEKESQKAKAKSVMMAKLKAISAFNNLYLDVSSKKEGGPGVQDGSGKQNVDINKLSFSDATNQMMNEMELKLKKKEEEINKQKEMDIEKGAAERIKAISAILFAGSKGKDVASLKNEPAEKLKEKVESIQDLLDVKESPKVRSISLQTARKKIMVINAFQTSGKEFLDRTNALDLEEQELKKKAALEAKMEEDRRQAELARNEELERQNFYKLVQERARAAKFTENLKQKSGVGQQAAGAVAVQEEKTKVAPEFGAKKEFDEVRGAITTPDFMVWLLTNRDCQIRRNLNGTFYVIISKFKLSKVVQASRKDAIWFVNTSGKATPIDGGLECKYFCKDPAIYIGNLYNNPRRELYLSNLIIQLGKAPQEPFEIYSSVPGNKPIKVPINECKMAF